MKAAESRWLRTKGARAERSAAADCGRFSGGSGFRDGVLSSLFTLWGEGLVVVLIHGQKVIVVQDSSSIINGFLKSGSVDFFSSINELYLLDRCCVFV